MLFTVTPLRESGGAPTPRLWSRFFAVTPAGPTMCPTPRAGISRTPLELPCLVATASRRKPATAWLRRTTSALILPTRDRISPRPSSGCGNRPRSRRPLPSHEPWPSPRSARPVRPSDHQKVQPLAVDRPKSKIARFVRARRGLGRDDFGQAGLRHNAMAATDFPGEFLERSGEFSIPTC